MSLKPSKKLEEFFVDNFYEKLSKVRVESRETLGSVGLLDTKTFLAIMLIFIYYCRTPTFNI